MTSIFQQKTFIIHDIETFPNFFCVVFKFEDRYLVFEISKRRDDYEKLKAFLYKCARKQWFLVGFNSVRFDGQILEWILDKGDEILEGMSGAKKAREIHFFAQEVIAKANARQFLPYAEYKLTNLHIDLFLQNHYNNNARATSLKWLEFSMNWKKVQDLPFKYDEKIKSKHFDDVIHYCKNDVDATDEFFGKRQELIELRFSQQRENPDLNLINKADSTIGEMLFLKMMSEQLGVPMRVLKKRQTHHSVIKLKKTIIPYIKFKTDEFNQVLNYFREAEITSTNNAFKYKVNYKGIDYVYGTGGLHASWDNKIFKETKDMMILDLDVSSYYPNLSIQNEFYPQHLSKQFCILYKDIYEKRQKIPKSNPQNKSLKLSLNSVYGKSGDIYSFLYDKFFQMCITVNGQLLLTWLAEELSLIKDVDVIQCNTDGVTIYMPKKDNAKKKVWKIWNKFEKRTGLTLEHAVYKQMFVRDVNNYMAVYEDGKIKQKGALEIDVEYHKNRSQRIVPIAVKRYFVDNIPVEDTIKHHLDVPGYDWDEEKEEFKIEGQGIFDFCIGKKIKSNQNYTLEKPIEVNRLHYSDDEKMKFLESDGWYPVEGNWEEGKYWRNEALHTSEKAKDSLSVAFGKWLDKYEPDFKIVQNIEDKVIRFFVSKKGNYLTKNYNDGRREMTVSGKKVTLFMDYYEGKYKIDYDYYIEEVNKIIHEIDGTNAKLAEEERKRKEAEAEEKQRLKEEEKKKHKENMFVKYCLQEKGPTRNQYNRYAEPWLLEKYGEIENIR